MNEDNEFDAWKESKSDLIWQERQTELYKIAEAHYEDCVAGKCRRRWWKRDWALTIYAVVVGGGAIWALIWCARFIERGGR